MWCLSFDPDLQHRCLCVLRSFCSGRQAPFCPIMLPWFGSNGWQCSGGRDSLVARGQSYGHGFYLCNCLGDFLSNDYCLKMHIFQNMVWDFQTTRFLPNTLPSVILCWWLLQSSVRSGSPYFCEAPVILSKQWIDLVD